MSALPSTVSPPPLVARRWALWARMSDEGAATFDAEGRLLTASLADGYFRRGLDNTIVRLERGACVALPWEVERRADPSALLARIAALWPQADLAPGSARAGHLAERARAGLASGYASDAREFLRAVGPVPILPPNHSRSIVFRLTEGCEWNVCRFCTLYRDVPFRVKTAAEFRAHVRAVLDYFGEGAGMRPAIYLGEASVLEAGLPALHHALAVLHEEVRIVAEPGPGAGLAQMKGDDPRAFSGIYGFADVKRAAGLGADDARALARSGVRRLYLGVESGHDPLLRELAKPHRAADVRAAVRALHAGGIGAGIILLVGAGGRGAVAEHRRATLELLAGLGLGESDFVFLSPLDPEARAGPAAGSFPLSLDELANETRRLAGTLRAGLGPRLRIAEYHLESFVY